MSGTKAGAAKSVATILARDPDFYKRIGAIGGANGNTGGFAANPELARIAGIKGGRISRRGKSKSKVQVIEVPKVSFLKRLLPWT